MKEHLSEAKCKMKLLHSAIKIYLLNHFDREWTEGVDSKD